MRSAAALTLVTFEQMAQQVRVDGTAPGLPLAITAAQREPQQRQRQQREQPQRPQEMEVAEHHRATPSCNGSAPIRRPTDSPGAADSSASSSAIDNGQ